MGCMQCQRITIHAMERHRARYRRSPAAAVGERTGMGGDQAYRVQRRARYRHSPAVAVSKKIGMAAAALRQCGGGALAAGWQAIQPERFWQRIGCVSRKIGMVCLVYRLWARLWQWRAFQRVLCVLGVCAVVGQHCVAYPGSLAHALRGVLAHVWLS